MSPEKIPLKPWFLVWNIAHGLPSRQHSDFDLAITEARRLASLNKGHTYHVLGVIASVAVEDPVQVNEYDKLKTVTEYEDKL